MNMSQAVKQNLKWNNIFLSKMNQKIKYEKDEIEENISFTFVMMR